MLDEFHTYDGAQGADVAILLRRLGLALRSHVPTDHPDRAQYDGRPLGKITPVATSATLGDSGDPTAMLAFAGQVFGETLDRDAAITEGRVDSETVTVDARRAVNPEHERKLTSLLAADLKDLAAVGCAHAADRERLLAEVIRVLYKGDANGDLPTDVNDATLLQAHSGVRQLIDLATEATHVDELVDVVNELGLVVGEAAARLGVSRVTLSRVLHGHARCIGAGERCFTRAGTGRAPMRHPTARDFRVDPAATCGTNQAATFRRRGMPPVRRRAGRSRKNSRCRRS